jgi:hypothetical protein
MNVDWPRATAAGLFSRFWEVVSQARFRGKAKSFGRNSINAIWWLAIEIARAAYRLLPRATTMQWRVRSEPALALQALHATKSGCRREA